MTTTAPAPLFGAKKQGAELIDLNAADPFGETPFFYPGMDEDKESDYSKAWPVNAEICGVLKALRVTKPTEPGRKPYAYACMETVDGQLFRVATPGQLKWMLQNRVGVGGYVEITYVGKEFVEKLGEECHQFLVNSDRQIVEEKH